MTSRAVSSPRVVGAIDEASRPRPRATMTTPLLFEAPASAPDAGFWAALARVKLNDDKLSQNAMETTARISTAMRAGTSRAVSLDAFAFDDVDEETRASASAAREWVTRGRVRCLNTREAMTTFDRDAMTREMGASLLEDIVSGAAEREPERLRTFGAIAYACLKSWSFTYWFCFPAATSETFKVESSPVVVMSNDDANDAAVVETCERWIANGGACAWLVSEDGREARALTEYVAGTRGGEKMRLAFADSCCAATHPGWALRNLAVLASLRWSARELDVVCVRSRKGRVAAEACVKFTMSIPEFDAEKMKVVGWERNARGKTGPRKVDLGVSMDPTQLATQAVDLNLKLMRWRLLPELNQEKLAATKCLLIGAGTLGCAVARTIMGWGIKHITFVDSGRVSYSNPVRQSLFEFKDCFEGGAHKAEAAAKKLVDIFPGVTSKGVMMSIPMPGHSVGEESKSSVFRDIDDLEALIDEHDVVYVLTDTRESRWLPTVICADKNKVCINAALGFNTYVVMRHGCGADAASDSRLGCYFCNDVMAPANSTRDRTLDQQCTVTRPGLAPIASALAAELMVALLHSNDGHATAPPDRDGDSNAPESEPSPLGVVPHQIRGSVAGFTQTLFDAPSFPRCTACSEKIVKMYRDDRDAFLSRVFDDPKTLEDATGLTELLGAVDADDAEWLDDGDSEGDDF